MCIIIAPFKGLYIYMGNINKIYIGSGKIMDQHLRETLVDSVPVFDGKMIKLRVDCVQLPNGKKATREVVEHPGAVAVVPVLPDQRIILVKQYRHPVEQITWEIPAGKLEGKENPDICAERELEEETGYKAGELIKLTAFYTAPGFTDEIIHLYIARGLEQTIQNTDADEFIDVMDVSHTEALGMVQRGEIKDAKSIIGILMVKEYI
jgi:ADP-ribose pyrophosphatase